VVVLISGGSGWRTGQHLNHVAMQKHHSPAALGIQRLQHRSRIQAWQPVGDIGKITVVTQQLTNPDPTNTVRDKVFQRQLRPVLGDNLPTLAVVLQAVK
jgi:hypothetical protein